MNKVYNLNYLWYNNCSILTGDKKGYIKKWNLNNYELKLIEENKVHDNSILVISQLKDGLLLSGSEDTKINIY